MAPAVTWLPGCVPLLWGPAVQGVTFRPAGQGLSVPHCLAMTGLCCFFLFLSKRINRPRNCSREDPSPSHGAMGGSVGEGSSDSKTHTGRTLRGGCWAVAGDRRGPATCLGPGTLGLWVEREPTLDQGRPFPVRLSGLTGNPPPGPPTPRLHAGSSCGPVVLWPHRNEGLP